MSLRTYTKSPTDELDYYLNWGKWLKGENITSSSWAVPADLTKTRDGIVDGFAFKTVVWITGGTIGKEHLVTNTIVTSAGRTVSRSIKIKIVQN